jgi:hypothetical protein
MKVVSPLLYKTHQKVANTHENKASPRGFGAFDFVNVVFNRLLLPVVDMNSRNMF